MTQKELAAAAGVSMWMVVGYEARNANPPVDVLPRLAGALSVTVDELVGDPSAAKSSVMAPSRKKERRSAGTRRTLPNKTAKTADGFGRRLAQIRKSRGLTQQALGEAVDVSNRMIAYYELEDGNPPVAVLVRLAATLKVTVDELVGNKASNASGAPRSIRVWRRVQALEQLPDRQRRQALDVLDALIEREQAKTGR
jgi:transcriptional regulator with XRE-family HTH domain